MPPYCKALGTSPTSKNSQLYINREHVPTFLLFHFVRLQVKQLHKLDLSKLSFVGNSLTALRSEVGNTAAVLGE